jgi:hypothetical protein
MVPVAVTWALAPWAKMAAAPTATEVIDLENMVAGGILMTRDAQRW